MNSCPLFCHKLKRVHSSVMFSERFSLSTSPVKFLRIAQKMRHSKTSMYMCVCVPVCVYIEKNISDSCSPLKTSNCTYLQCKTGRPSIIYLRRKKNLGLCGPNSCAGSSDWHFVQLGWDFVSLQSVAVLWLGRNEEKETRNQQLYSYCTCKYVLERTAHLDRSVTARDAPRVVSRFTVEWMLMKEVEEGKNARRMMRDRVDEKRKWRCGCCPMPRCPFSGQCGTCPGFGHVFSCGCLCECFYYEWGFLNWLNACGGCIITETVFWLDTNRWLIDWLRV